MLQRLRPDIPLEHLRALLEIKGRVAAGSLRVTMLRTNNCIGGNMADLLRENRIAFVFEQPIYADLFFPPQFQLRSWYYTPQKNVVRAIDRFLANKKPWPWF